MRYRANVRKKCETDELREEYRLKGCVRMLEDRYSATEDSVDRVTYKELVS